MTLTADSLLLFGATGDLAQRMLLPSLFALHADGLIPPQLAMLCTADGELTSDDFRSLVGAAIERYLPAERRRPGTAWDFLKQLRYVQLDASQPESFGVLSKALGNGGTRNIAIFLSTAPSLFSPTIAGLQYTGLTGERARIGLEKPLGHDLASSRVINDAVAAAFPEERTFRVDHYLGKETVQNLLALRFGNWLFEPLWNASGIDQVQISVSETMGLEGRSNFYDDAGALRDMVQNHMLQLLALVAMEPPAHYNAAEVRDEKVKVLRSLRSIDRTDGRHAHRHRPVRCRSSRRQARPWLSRRAGKAVKHRNLRRLEGPCRQLAMERCPVLSQDRQASAPPRIGNLHPVSSGASFNLRR